MTPDVNEKLVKGIIDSCDSHARKHGMRKMGLKELDDLTGI